jgi:hypothetical protein
MVVALSGLAKRKGVSSQSILLIYVKCLWVTLSPLVTKLGQYPPAVPLKHERKIPKVIRIRIKGMEWARKEWNL